MRRLAESDLGTHHLQARLRGFAAAVMRVRKSPRESSFLASGSWLLIAHFLSIISHTHESTWSLIMPTNEPLNRKLRMGLIGGGQGAFIGRVHSLAATLDNRAALVAGALSSDPAKAKASAPDYDIQPERAYGSFQEMIAAQAKLPGSERIDFAPVATPHHTHFEIARAFAEAGFNVVCDKPLTFDLKQAEELARIVQKTGVVFAVTHNYTGYPLVRQARDMVKSGELGEINAVRAFYIQGWLRTPLEKDEQKQASWRTDPKR